VLLGTTYEMLDDREDYGEERWVAIGTLRGDVVVLVFAEYDDEFRLISLRKAEPHERRKFEEHIAGRI
jgi:uncharacterized DUF497 family protein